MTAQITLKEYVQNKLNDAANNMDNSVVNSREWIRHNARKVAFANALTVADNVEDNADSYGVARSYYLEQIQEANHKVVEPGSDLAIAWDARYCAFEDIYSVLRFGTRDLGLTINQWIHIMEGER